MPRTSPLITSFIKCLEVERGLSWNTRQSYLADLLRLQAWSAKNQLIIRGLSCRDLERHIADLSRANLSPVSINRVLTTLRSFYGFLTNEGEIPANPTTNLGSLKKIRSLPHVLTIAELRRLLHSPDLNSINGLRDRALLEILFAAGLRISEAIRLRHADVELDRRILRCIGKGDKERQVPFTQSATDALRAYVKALHPHSRPKPAAYIFLNQSTPLTRQLAWTLIKRYAAQAGVPAVSPHSLRHTFATSLLNTGVPTKLVQQLLGHSHISTTEIYLTVSHVRLRDTYDRHHPRAVWVRS
jgi:integrase/recombinase XerD